MCIYTHEHGMSLCTKETLVLTGEKRPVRIQYIVSVAQAHVLVPLQESGAGAPAGCGITARGARAPAGWPINLYIIHT